MPENATQVKAEDHCDPHAARRQNRHQLWSRDHQHTHPHAEFLFILSGGGAFTLASQTICCRPGRAFYLPPNTPHDKLYPSWSRDRTHLWFGLLSNRVFIQHYRINSAGKAISSHLPRSVRGGLDFSFPSFTTAILPEWLELKLRAILQLLIVLAVESGQAEPEPNERDFPREVVTAIARHIEENSGCGISLKSLARLSGYSPFHLARLFKKHQGYPIHAYVDQCRLKRVEELRRAEYSHKQIGLELGFSSAPAFSRWYSKQKKKLERDGFVD